MSQTPVCNFSLLLLKYPKMFFPNYRLGGAIKLYQLFDISMFGFLFPADEKS